MSGTSVKIFKNEVGCSNNLPQPPPYIFGFWGCGRLLHDLNPPRSAFLFQQFLARCHPYILLHFLHLCHNIIIYTELCILPVYTNTPLLSKSFCVCGDECVFISLRVHKMPEVCLPNFFMPPQELERTMKVLRASTLARPPPRTLFEGHCSSQHQLDYTHDSCTTQSSAVRTLEDVNHFLKSRRASGRDETPSSLDQCQSMSTKAVQRLSRIFVSQPLQTNKQ